MTLTRQYTVPSSSKDPPFALQGLLQPQLCPVLTMATSLEPAVAESKFHVVVDVKEESVCDGGSRERKCSSDGSGTEIVGEPSDKERRSSTSSSVPESCVDLDSEVKVHSEKVETRDCRICHLSMDLTNHESGIPMELGCSCKDDLAAAHKQCAEAWFKIKGNKTCEICGSNACNVVGVNEVELSEQWSESSFAGTASQQHPAVAETRNFWQGHRFLNFLLACMVFAFVISWLFHFNLNLPS